MTCTGIVRGNVVVLEEAACLPDGARVEVRLIESSTPRGEAFDRLLKQRAANAGLQVRMSEIIEAEKQEREEYPDRWLSRNP